MATKKREKKQKAELNPNLVDFWTTPARNRILYGGRVSSKSWDAAGVITWISKTYKVKVLCARQFQNKIEESVYTLIKQQISRFGFDDHFRILNNKILCPRTGSEFIFYGLWRNITEIKSTEDVDILWIEEAHDLSESQWEILEPTIRNEGSEVWIIFNPQILTDFVYQKFIIDPPEDTVKRLINYNENPYLSDTILKVINNKKENDYEEYEYIYLGVPRNDDDSVIIKRKWINAAIDAHIKLDFEPKGQHRIGFDVADDGGDRCANTYAHGPVALELDYWKANEDELLKSCKRTYHNALKWELSHITYDGIGVGAHSGSKFNELNEESGHKLRHGKFIASGKVVNPDRKYAPHIKNKDMFSNLKSQAWWSVADRFRNTWDAVQNGTQYPPEELISISSKIKDLEKLVTELSTPKKDYDSLGRVKVESKDDLEDREIPSPDLAESFIMAFSPMPRRKSVLDVLISP